VTLGGFSRRGAKIGFDSLGDLLTSLRKSQAEASSAPKFPERQSQFTIDHSPLTIHGKKIPHIAAGDS